MSATDHPFDFDFNDHSLAGRVILVAGGAGGLGSATSALLARDGATVVIGYRDNRERAEALQSALETTYAGRTQDGGRVRLVGGDIGEAETRRRYVETADAIGEGLYAVVCFTGNPARVKFEEANEADLQASYLENYIAPVLLAREAAARMRARNRDSAVVLFSTMQAVAPFESSLNYAAPKTALVQAARVLAKQWGGPDGIRVNVVAPGVNRAGMALASIEAGKYDSFVDDRIIPRFGRAEDVARVVRLLVEPDNYITGQVITVDGGLTLRRDRA